MNETTPAAPKVRITKNGPYIVSGIYPLAKRLSAPDSAGESVQWEHGRNIRTRRNTRFAAAATVRTSHSATARTRKLVLTALETANRAPYREQAKVMKGPTLTLTDVEPVRVRALLRPQRFGVEPGERNGQFRRARAFPASDL
jgi:hypothetical protein